MFKIFFLFLLQAGLAFFLFPMGYTNGNTTQPSLKRVQEMIQISTIVFHEIERLPSIQYDCFEDNDTQIFYAPSPTTYLAQCDVNNYQGMDTPSTTVSRAELEDLFHLMASKDYIPFSYPEDGCYARAHEMGRILAEKGIITSKIFLEGDLHVNTTNSPKGYVEWWYHVAVLLKLQEGGKEIKYVLDPSLFDRPVPLQEWVSIQTNNQKRACDALYETTRFQYVPMDKDAMKSNYNSLDLLRMNLTLKQYQGVDKARKAIPLGLVIEDPLLEILDKF